MARLKQAEHGITPPSATRQVAFHQLLVAARRTVLLDALSEALASVDPAATRAEIQAHAPRDVLQILAAAGIRDEHVFPTCVVLTAKPTLVGYYRLLLGSPQKSFYAGATGLGLFKSAESAGILTRRQRELLPEFCGKMTAVLAELIRQVSPRVTRQDITELPLLTFGAQLQGANNNIIGQMATEKVFLAVAAFVTRHVIEQQPHSLTLRNSAGRTVMVRLGTDPDVEVVEDFGGNFRNILAIEIKGGSDRSNAHNRAGEAEKSHQKAKNRHFSHFWTLIAKEGLNLDKLREESPTTTEWFDIAHILAQSGDEWRHFRSHLAGILGIPETQ